MREPNSPRALAQALTKLGKLLLAARQYIVIAIGSAIYAAGLHCFTAPNDIAPGGIGGIATVLARFFPLNVGTLYGLLNIPLLIVGFIFLGKKLMIKTVFSVAIITLCTDYLFIGLPVYKGDMIIAAVFGGVLFGIALGLVYRCESTSGGTDIINKIFNVRYPHISLGMITLFTDIIVIIFAMSAFGNIEAGLYAIIAMYVCGKIIDVILYGSFEGKAVLIFSEHFAVITEKLLTESHRGVTLLKGSGGFSGKEKNVICCALRKNEYARVKRIVRTIDPSAFIITATANEVLGEGFAPLTDSASASREKRKR